MAILTMHLNPKQLARDTIDWMQHASSWLLQSKAAINLAAGVGVVISECHLTKTDSHAEDITKIVLEEFAEENKFCKKISYRNEEDLKLY